MSLLPEGYEYEYFVYNAAESVSEEEIILDMPYHKVVKRMMFKKFTNFIQENLEKQ